MSGLIVGVYLASTHFELALADEHFETQQRNRLSRS
jgi:hypothetical protein